MFAQDLFEDFKDDVESNSFIGVRYVDTWDYEDDYSHNEIDYVRSEFIKMSNKYFKENNMPYIMKEITENAMVCDLSGKILESK